MLVRNSEIWPVFVQELVERAPTLMSGVLLYCSNMSNLPFVSVLWTAVSCCQLQFLEGLIVSNNYKDIVLQRLCEDESLLLMAYIPSHACMALHQLN